jgi:hypothetical protein
MGTATAPPRLPPPAAVMRARTPERGGTWACECPGHPRALPEDVQRDGCDRHRVIPIMLQSWAEPVDMDGDAVVYRNKLTGHQFLNGPRPEGYSSAEIARMRGQARDSASRR